MDYAALAKNELLVTRVSDEKDVQDASQKLAVVHARLKYLWDEYNQRRQIKVKAIQRCWAQYFGTPEAQEFLRRQALNNDIGKVRTDWRHKISTGKAFEMVEYVVAYLMRATFPNEMWFDMLPLQELPDQLDWRMQVRLLTTFMRMKLDDAKFKEQWNIYLRQLCISGTSIMTCPWLLELKKTKKNVKVRSLVGDEIKTEEIEKIMYNAPQIKVEDVLDFCLDPDASDPQSANLFRRMMMSKGDVIRLVEAGIYDLVSKEDIVRCKPHVKGSSLYDTDPLVKQMLGITPEFHPNDTLEVYEFWGDVVCGGMEYKDVVITYTNSHVLRMETNPYWGGRPFIVGSLIPIPGSVYGYSILEPVGGLLQGLDIIFNQRLDGNEVTLNPMMGYINDGTDINDLYFEPGKIIPLTSPQALFPIFQNLSINSVSVTEEEIVEQKVDKVMGTGAFIGTGATRDAERVTAQEVQATRESGGVRLSEVYRHIEQTSLLPFLQRTYEYMRQFVVRDEIVPIQGQSVDEIIYGYVGIEELSIDYLIRPLGASHILEKETKLQQLMDWVGAVGASEQMVQYVNWMEVTKELTRHFLGGDVERFIVEGQPQPQGMPGMMPPDPAMMQQQAVLEGAGQVGGADLQRAVEGQLAVDGGQALMSGLSETMTPLPQ